MTPRVIVLSLASIMLAGCDTFGLGYVNKLHRPVTVVEHGYGAAQPFTLKPGEVKPVGFGRVADSIEVQGAQATSVAHYRVRDLRRTGTSRGHDYVVITPSGVLVERRDSFEYDQ